MRGGSQETIGQSRQAGLSRDRSPASTQWGAVKASVLRWADVLGAALVASVLTYLLWPLYRILWAAVAHYLSEIHWTSSYIVLVGVHAVLWAVITRLGGFRWRDLLSLTTLRYPPVWLPAVIVGLALPLCASLNDAAHTSLTDKALMILATFAVFFAGMLVAILLTGLASPPMTSISDAGRGLSGPTEESATLDERVDCDWLERERPIRSPEEDRFDHASVSKRIASLLSGPGRQTIGIIGAFGSGKSGILGMTEHYLRRDNQSNDPCRLGGLGSHPREILVSWVSGWGLRDEDVVGHVLSSVVRAVSRRLDSLAFANLPSSYLNAVATATGRWGSIVQVLSEPCATRTGVLYRLDSALAAAGIQVAIFIEDLDRHADDEALLRETGALLDELSRLSNISFVVALGQEHRKWDVLARVLEHTEIVSDLRPEQVQKEILEIRSALIEWSGAADIDPVASQWREQRFGTQQDPKLRVLFGERLRQPVEAIAHLLRTPRLLKQAIRRARRCWRALHGEIDVDDVFVVCALYAGAPETFAFVASHISRLRYLATEQSAGWRQEEAQKARAALLQELDELSGHNSWNAQAVMLLIKSLFPGSLDAHYGQKALQGVATWEPVDYWARLNAEQLNEGEIRDQDVLRSVQNLREYPAGPVYQGMRIWEAFAIGEDFGSRFEHLAVRLDAESVRKIAELVFAHSLETHGFTTHADNTPGFINLWRLSLGRHFGDHVEWVIARLKEALPVSLRFANDIYYYWRSQNRESVTTREGTPEIRAAFVEAAMNVFSGHPEALCKAIDPSFMYSIFHLSVLYSASTQGGSGFDAREWRWLGHTIVQCLSSACQVVLPQVVPLAVDDEHAGGGQIVFSFNEPRMVGFFGDELTQVMQALADGIDAEPFSSDARDRIEFAIQTAQKWLAYHPPA